MSCLASKESRKTFFLHQLAAKLEDLRWHYTPIHLQLQYFTYASRLVYFSDNLSYFNWLMCYVFVSTRLLPTLLTGMDIPNLIPHLLSLLKKKWKLIKKRERGNRLQLLAIGMKDLPVSRNSSWSSASRKRRYSSLKLQHCSYIFSQKLVGCFVSYAVDYGIVTLSVYLGFSL